MQTFLPYSNIRKSVQVLDSKRLGKQRVEAFQILNIILNRTKKLGWRNHPAVNMWRGYPNFLKIYINESISEWISRGFKNTMKFERIRGKIRIPDWFGNKTFHSSHKSNLLRKNQSYYSQFNWKEKNNLPYFWPV